LTHLFFRRNQTGSFYRDPHNSLCLLTVAAAHWSVEADSHQTQSHKRDGLASRPHEERTHWPAARPTRPPGRVTRLSTRASRTYPSAPHRKEYTGCASVQSVGSHADLCMVCIVPAERYETVSRAERRGVPLPFAAYLMYTSSPTAGEKRKEHACGRLSFLP